MEKRAFNPKAAARGRSAVHSGTRYARSIDSVGDLLLDLLHYCGQDGIDFDKELAYARQAFLEDLHPPVKRDTRHPEGL
jgi:hypothetical protein